jgi:hypothetical protein
VAEHNNCVALLDELVSAQLELVVCAEHLLQDLDRRLLSLIPPRPRKV